MRITKTTTARRVALALATAAAAAVSAVPAQAANLGADAPSAAPPRVAAAASVPEGASDIREAMHIAAHVIPIYVRDAFGGDGRTSIYDPTASPGSASDGTRIGGDGRTSNYDPIWSTPDDGRTSNYDPIWSGCRVCGLEAAER